jgi:hypothetical protein
MPEHACARCPDVASVFVTMCSECVGISEHFVWNLAFPPFFSPSRQFTSGSYHGRVWGGLGVVDGSATARGCGCVRHRIVV